MERVLFVHAHPADESIVTGGTIATLVDRRASVTVLTCTRGEGAELAAALAELGVTDHRWLGDSNARWAGREPRRYDGFPGRRHPVRPDPSPRPTPVRWQPTSRRSSRRSDRTWS